MSLLQPTVEALGRLDPPTAQSRVTGKQDGLRERLIHFQRWDPAFKFHELRCSAAMLHCVCLEGQPRLF